MLGLFVAALFTSAALLFWVQPMVAKMLLPLLGGTPAVWNTCMVFFQATLLAGYAYAHFLTTRFPVRLQMLIHGVLLLATVTLLPISLGPDVGRGAPWESDPMVWLLRALVIVVALPFFTLSASAPLLQSWFSRVRHRSSHDPYFLYAASNFGSLAGLIAYPTLIEPGFPLSTQNWIWAGGYVFLLLVFIGTATALWRAQRFPAPQPAPELERGKEVGRPAAEQKVTWSRRGQWMFWAFVPSSLMLGVTTYLSTDIASVPLLWVVPLGIYLVTFILVFSRRQVILAGLMARILPPLGVVLVFVMLTNADNLAWLQISLHLLFFFVAAVVWHGRLADDRPSARDLTQFYFCMSIGGVLGGIFNALVAPLVFRTAIEYRVAIILACVLWPRPGKPLFTGWRQWRELIAPLVIGGITATLALVVPRFGVGLQMSMMIVFGIPLILCYAVSKRGGRFELMLALGAVLVASGFYTAFHGRTLHAERNFFGILRYAVDPENRFYRLYHGTTVHGMESVDPARRGEPLAYYHRSGPCGQAMAAFDARGGTNVAVIGLGAGSMAAYAQRGQHWTFYEINPAVIRLAEDTNYFTFLHRCTNAVVDFKVGDARLRLREAAAGSLNLLVGDAFGSDAPPLHLLDREALALYLSKLAPDGWLLLHISSRYLNFRPVIGNLAEYFHLAALVNTDDEPATPEGKLPSCWVVLARNEEDLGALRDDSRWQPLPPAPGMRLWTDDFSNILSVFDWR